MECKHRAGIPWDRRRRKLIDRTVSTIALLIIYKCLFSKGNSKKRNNIMIIGPSLSGKTSFFYHLLGKKNAKTVVMILHPPSLQRRMIDEYSSRLGVTYEKM